MDSPKATPNPIGGVFEHTGPLEKLQNEALRPILKAQNEALVQVYRHFLQKRHVPFAKMANTEQKAWVADSLSKDNRLRGLLIGMVIAGLNAAQLELYLNEEAEVNRRIIGMATQRLQSQLEAFLS
jgi:ATP-dependent protease Clp ATPase subunit